MSPAGFQSAFSRVFACWPSRVGGIALLALLAAWGSETMAAARPAAESVAAAGW